MNDLLGFGIILGYKWLQMRLFDKIRDAFIIFAIITHSHVDI